jgi:serine/threonine protein kinase
MDFGFACDDEIGHQDGRCGTDPYISPETWVYNDASNTHKDLWAIGMTAIFLAVDGNQPWDRAIPSSKLYKDVDICYDEYVRNPRVLRERYPISREFDSFLRKVLHPDPEKRLDLNDMELAVRTMPRFLMDPKELTSAAFEARETAFSMGLFPFSIQSEGSIRPVSIRAVNQFDPELGDIALQPFPSRSELRFSSLVEDADDLQASEMELGSPSVSGSTLVGPITPEMVAAGAGDVAVVD